MVKSTKKDGMKLFGYCDESGNSGLNLFDKNQPFFWVGVLISEADLNGTAMPKVNTLLNNIGKKELHGNEMGISLINEVSLGIKEILIENKCQAIFVKIEKVFLAKLKMFDYLFDNTNNKAVSSISYGIRLLRLMLANSFCSCVSDEDAEYFWNIYKNPRVGDISRLLENIKKSINNKITDKRMKELIIDAIQWAKKHPLEVFNCKLGKIDSPNVVAFSQILLSINNLYGDNNFTVEKIFHDSQNQFGRSLLDTFKHYEHVQSDFSALTILHQINLIDIYKKDLKIVSSDNECGIQIIDVLLYMVKKNVQQKIMFEGDCKKLYDYLTYHSSVIEISQASYENEVLRLKSEIMSRSFTQEDASKGMKLLNEFEMQRKTRMNN